MSLIFLVRLALSLQLRKYEWLFWYSFSLFLDSSYYDLISFYRIFSSISLSLFPLYFLFLFLQVLVILFLNSLNFFYITFAILRYVFISYCSYYIWYFWHFSSYDDSSFTLNTVKFCIKISILECFRINTRHRIVQSELDRFSYLYLEHIVFQ